MKASTTFETEEGDFFVVVLDCDCVCLKKCGGEYCVLGVRIVNGLLKGETDCENGECVKERREERYCCRAGVMPRNEGEEEEELFV